MVGMKVRIDVGSLRKFRLAVARDIEMNGNGPLGRALDHSALLYIKFLQGRFANGGAPEPWTPLAPRTVQKKGHGIILVEDEHLEDAFSPSGTNITRRKGGRRISLKPTKHPNAGIPMNQLASIHQLGLGRNLPARELFVEADSKTTEEIGEVVREGMRRTLRQTGAGK